MSELFGTIKEATKESARESAEETMHSRENSTESLGSEIENVATQMSEVMYIGKITVSESKAPPSFIDEAVQKFAEYEKRKATLGTANKVESEDSGSLSSSIGSIEKIKSVGVSRRTSGSLDEINISNDSDMSFNSTSSNAFSDGNLSVLSSSSNEVSSIDRANHKQRNWDDSTVRKLSLVSLSYDSLDHENNRASLRESSSASDLMSLERSGRGNTNLRKISLQRGITATKLENRNRTMLIGVGKRSLTLISPDRKSVILERNFKDISFCAQVILLDLYFIRQKF